MFFLLIVQSENKILLFWKCDYNIISYIAGRLTNIHQMNTNNSQTQNNYLWIIQIVVLYSIWMDTLCSKKR